MQKRVPLSALSATGYSCIREERFLSPDRSLSRLIHSQISHAPESADLLYLENFIGNRITNLDGAKPGKWRAMIRTKRRIWVSDSASLQPARGTADGHDLRSANDTPALNALKALRGAPISMGRGKTPVGGCQPPSGFAISLMFIF
ncbi:MAG: hypothetical protein U0O29_09985 [Oscillospiraceae bacterium]